jgi:hypothetical protein
MHRAAERYFNDDCGYMVDRALRTPALTHRVLRRMEETQEVPCVTGGRKDVQKSNPLAELLSAEIWSFWWKWPEVASRPNGRIYLENTDRFY